MAYDYSYCYILILPIHFDMLFHSGGNNYEYLM